MTRTRGELPEPEEALLGIIRPTQEQEDEAAAKNAEHQQVRDTLLKQLMTSDVFRDWLMEQLVAFETFGSPFGVSPAGFPDPMATQFRLGMKAAGWHLWEQLDALAPEHANLMRREWKGRGR